MVSLGLNILYVLAISLLANGLAIPKEESLLSRDDLVARDAKFLKLNFDVSKTTNVTNFLVRPNEAGKRADIQSLPLNNEKYWYSVTLEIGSNKDTVKVDIDTGSSDLWVTEKTATCTPSQGLDSNYCKTGGTYDSSKSTTYKNLNENFRIGYVDGSSASGGYATEDITIPGGPTIHGFQFGDVTTSDIQQGGILGVGYSTNEAEGSYDNFPVLLKKQGIIDKVAYSLYLNSQSATTGSIIFGGVDNAKYSGSLISNPTTSKKELAITLNSVSYDGGSTNFGSDAVLDSGTTYTYLTDVSPIVKALGAQKNGDLYIALCKQPNKSVSYNFGNNAKIQVPYSALLSDPLSYTDNTVSPYCQLLAGQSDINLLGDSFLRSAYVVYDLQDNKISVAQVKYTSDSSISSI